MVVDRGMDDEVFVLSDMTVEVHQLEHGQVIGFNGTTEWALDSVEDRDAVWLPRESQLRELLAGDVSQPGPGRAATGGCGWRSTRCRCRCSIPTRSRPTRSPCSS